MPSLTMARILGSAGNPPIAARKRFVAGLYQPLKGSALRADQSAMSLTRPRAGCGANKFAEKQ